MKQGQTLWRQLQLPFGRASLNHFKYTLTCTHPLTGRESGRGKQRGRGGGGMKIVGIFSTAVKPGNGALRALITRYDSFRGQSCPKDLQGGGLFWWMQNSKLRHPAISSAAPFIAFFVHPSQRRAVGATRLGKGRQRWLPVCGER